MKKILIIGDDSYIGIHFYDWIKKYEGEYAADIVSSRDYKWKEKNFENYDTVVNFAGIAHIKKLTEDLKPLFYSVNRDLLIEIGTKAKESGVRHFLTLSSMNVYGEFCQNLTDRETATPSNYYGDSKLQGDIGLLKLKSDDFLISCVRPPFVYGFGCKGNYNALSKISKFAFVLPTYKNKKSMIYVDNLCEFIRLAIDNRTDGILTPQNKELMSTAEIIRQIRRQNGKKTLSISLFNCLVPFLTKLSGAARKAFSDDYYELEFSNYFDFNYDVVPFEKSIKITEGKV